MTYQLQHQFDRPFAAIAEMADAYAQALTPQTELKLDNRAYSLSALAAWAELPDARVTPVVDPELAPTQTVPESLAVDYLDLLG